MVPADLLQPHRIHLRGDTEGLDAAMMTPLIKNIGTSISATAVQWT